MKPLFEVESLTHDFGGLRAVSDLSFSLKPGEMHAIVGPNGCGKTTLFNIISGALKPTAGRVCFKGQEITGRAPQKIAALGLKRKFQVPSIFMEMPVRDNLRLASLGGEKPGGPFSLLAHAKGDGGEQLDGLLSLAGLLDRANDFARELSHGERQRLEIAMVMAGKAELMLLDEPTAGMTLGESRAVAEFLCQLNEKSGPATLVPAVLVIEHDMKVVQALGAKVSVMVRGRFIATGTYETVSEEPLVREAYLGPLEEGMHPC